LRAAAAPEGAKVADADDPMLEGAAARTVGRLRGSDGRGRLGGSDERARLLFAASARGGCSSEGRGRPADSDRAVRGSDGRGRPEEADRGDEATDDGDEELDGARARLIAGRGDAAGLLGATSRCFDGDVLGESSVDIEAMRSSSGASSCDNSITVGLEKDSGLGTDGFDLRKMDEGESNFLMVLQDQAMLALTLQRPDS